MYMIVFLKPLHSGEPNEWETALDGRLFSSKKEAWEAVDNLCEYEREWTGLGSRWRDSEFRVEEVVTREVQP